MHALFCLQLALLDLAMRGPRFYAAHPRALLHLAASAAALHLAASLRASRRARLAIAVALGLVLVAQAAFYRYFHAPLDAQVALAARRAWPDVRAMLLPAAPMLAALVLAVAALEAAWLGRLARVSPPRLGRAPRLAAAALVGVGLALGGPPSSGTTETRVAHAALALATTHDPPPHAGRPALPPLPSRRARVPNVLFVLTESVRASDYCGDAGEPCAIAPEVSALLPQRVALHELRAASSYTAISLSVLLTGRLQLGPREPIAEAPDLFDLGRATRAGEAPVRVHYWSSHSGTIFERADVEHAVDSYVSADTMMGAPIDDVEDAITHALDRRLADECAARVPRLEPPYFAMVHFSGTHAPYFFDDAAAKYTPFQRHVTWSGLDDVHRAYQNAILEQDRSIARCVKAFLDAQRGGPYVVVFTSDHGEEFGEHKAIHHGQNLYDTQIHVPGFVAAGGGALDDAEGQALAAASREPLTHLDLLPTFLDVLGVLDRVELVPTRREMPGRSLLRPRPAPAPLPLTNCSAMWACPINGWGVLAGDRKLTAQPWDPDWRCLALAGGEHEVPLAQCADLVEASRASFEKRPNGEPNR
jgi:hypothetical protein